MNALRPKRAAGAASTLAAMAIVALVAAAPAAAGDFYVDDDSGSDANACTSQGSPCLTINAGLNRANASAGSGDTVWVDGGDYDESVDVGDGNSLRELDFNAADDDTQASIYYNASPSFPAVRVLPGHPAGTIDGFRLGSNGSYAVTLADTAVVTNNTFDWIEDGSPGMFVGQAGNGSTVSDNVFDAIPGPIGIGIEIAGGHPTIDGNQLRDLSDAIRIDAGGDVAATIRDNEITGLVKEAGFAHGIQVGEGASAEISGNAIRDPDGASNTIGVNAQDDGFSVLGTGVQLEANRIQGQDIGVRLVDTAVASLFDDLITGNATGIAAATTGIDNGDVAATNVTMDGNGTDISLSDDQLSLNSSILGSGIESSAGGGTATCSIAFSAGPTTTPGGSGCESFQTSPNPRFVDPGAGDYRLKKSSALIDAGDPAAVSGTDFEGDPRVLDGNGDGIATRDIGADEFDPAPPNTTITSGPANGSFITDTTPTFGFVSDQAGSTFKCRVDSAVSVACTSPNTTQPLADGTHTYRVTATDQIGNVEPTPATRTFTVDTTAPVSAIVSGPAQGTTTKSRTAKFGFGSNERGSTFTCRLDSKPWSACTSPYTTPTLQPGSHAFRVRARDRAGNVDATPALRTWKIVR